MSITEMVKGERDVRFTDVVGRFYGIAKKGETGLSDARFLYVQRFTSDGGHPVSVTTLTKADAVALREVLSQFIEGEE